MACLQSALKQLYMDESDQRKREIRKQLLKQMINDEKKDLSIFLHTKRGTCYVLNDFEIRYTNKLNKLYNNKNIEELIKIYQQKKENNKKIINILANNKIQTIISSYDIYKYFVCYKDKDTILNNILSYIKEDYQLNKLYDNIPIFIKKCKKNNILIDKNILKKTCEIYVNNTIDLY